MVLCGLIAKRLYGRTHKHEKSNLRQTAEKFRKNDTGCYGKVIPYTL